MAIPSTPTIADKARFNSVQPLQSTALVAQLTTSATNTATTATLVTGLTATTNVVGSLVKYVRVMLSADSVSNSGANNVILTCWVGTVGSGTQVAQSSYTVQSGALSSVDTLWLIPVTTAGTIVAGSSYTINVGMHGSGAGTNTLTAGATLPVTMTVEFI